jgi:hypothetical protein
MRHELHAINEGGMLAKSLVQLGEVLRPCDELWLHLDPMVVALQGHASERQCLA